MAAAAGTAVAAIRAATAGDTPEVTDQATIEMVGIEMADMGKHRFFTIFFPAYCYTCGRHGSLSVLTIDKQIRVRANASVSSVHHIGIVFSTVQLRVNL